MNLRHRGSYLCTAADAAEMVETVSESENSSAETETENESANDSAVPEMMKYYPLSQISQI